MTNTNLYPISKIAIKFGLKPDTLRKKILSGCITGATKINQRWYFDELSLNKAIFQYKESALQSNNFRSHRAVNKTDERQLVRP